MTPMISEIVDEVRAAKTRKEKIAVLRKYVEFRPWLQIVSYVFETEKYEKSDVKWPEYKESDIPLGLAPRSLSEAYKKLYLLFNAGDNEKLKTVAKNSYLVLIESLCKEEQEILTSIANQKFKGISRKLIDEAYGEG